LQPTPSSSLLSLLWLLPQPWPVIPVLSKTCVSQITRPMCSSTDLSARIRSSSRPRTSSSPVSTSL
ncbi:unnamed protein product, partial [Musa acuminata var. zebrina]